VIGREAARKGGSFARNLLLLWMVRTFGARTSPAVYVVLRYTNSIMVLIRYNRIAWKILR